ncbi:TetR/AcrR family transcriptional regulator [Agromyces sp. S2-1-8]|uniref:TetR/AcrR family transcriptional regulator n=1 Tax=Agromyces TaxID=33877 RepID=UPI0035ABA5E8
MALNEKSFDAVTLAAAAEQAGVSTQTVVNHFGSKSGLFAAVARERFLPWVAGLRGVPPHGDIDAAVAAVFAEYEVAGAAVMRGIAIADRNPLIAEGLEGGGRYHREWVCRAFAAQLAAAAESDREDTAELLATALDVRTWSLLRDGGRISEDVAQARMRRLVLGVLRTVADHPEG